jgi:hypothetical protein
MRHANLALPSLEESAKNILEQVNWEIHLQNLAPRITPPLEASTEVSKDKDKK